MAASSLGHVVTYGTGSGARAAHEWQTQNEAARRLAALHGFEFAGEFDPARHYPGQVYFVPNDTLDTATAREFGIRDEMQLFGGIVPHPFVATKAIAHPLVEPGASAPAAWSREFSRRVRDIVHAGYCAFTPADARRAGAQLLEAGPVRVKPVNAAGGQGQSVAADEAELADALASVDESELRACGVVLEENLAEVETHSVGRVFAAGILMTYCGSQRLTPNNHGSDVYGGSDLIVARGDFDALLQLPLPDERRLAVQQGRAFDRAVSDCYPGLVTSRCNYDVAQGRSASGQWQSGVLEQSWRIGGATPAELAALEVFQSNPAVQVVRAGCTEIYGECDRPPPNACIYFQGIDERVGPMTKYAWIEPHADTR